VSDPLYRQLARLNLSIVQARERVEIVQRLLCQDGYECDQLAKAYAAHCGMIRSLKARRQGVLAKLNARPKHEDMVLRLSIDASLLQRQ